jgi:hypothetical protein
MSFQIHALPPEPFAPYFAMSEEALVLNKARLVTCDASPGYPCRVSLADAEPGERLVLVNHTHLPEASPYRASHAIYVREGVTQASPAPGEVPDVLARRLLSVRAYGADHLMRVADVTDGRLVAQAIEAMLADPEVAYLHLHNARQGCFAAKVTRG